jgi:hypothetical protein
MRRRLLWSVLVALVAFVPVWSPGRAVAANDAWNLRVLPIAKEVEKLRGLKFERPVPVTFLSDAAFEKKVRVDKGKLSASDKAEIERSEAQMRAVGLLPDGVNLIDAVSSLQTSGALAYYDPKTKRATVRGEQLDVATKVTLAHELTHALQDQHFGLEKLQRTARRKHGSAALTALVEGDAVRVQQLYAAQLPSAERAAYAASGSSGAEDALREARAAGVPDSLVVLFQSPYALGPLMLEFVQAAKGGHAIDGLFRHPPTADSAFLTPSTLVDGSTVTNVSPPALQAGERADGKPDVFGSFALYLILAARSDPVAALAVSDGWAGDAMITFTRNDTTCVRASFAGRTPEAGTAIFGALRDWVASGTPGAADVQQDGSLTSFTACDPGAAGSATPDRSFAALTVAAVRNTFLAKLATQGVSVAVAGCTANGVVADPAFRPLLDAAAADPNAVPDAVLLTPFQQSVASIATQCALKR